MELSNPTAIPELDTEENIAPLCCWCNAPLHVDEQRVAWCSGSATCRERQLACSIHVTKDGKRRFLFIPSPKQVEIMTCAIPNVFIYGNRGGGKSICVRWWAHALATAIPNFKYVLLRTSFPELMKNHLSYLEGEMQDLGGRENGFSYHKTDHICYYPNGSMGYYAQCANDADVKKILGAEAALIIFDEAPTFVWNHMRLIAGSLRAPVGSDLIPMMRFLGNPIGESIDELWRYCIDRDVSPDEDPEYRPRDWGSIEIRIEDNPHLNRKEYWRQFAGIAKHYLKAWREGLRVEPDALFEYLPTVAGKPYHEVTEIPRFTNGEPLFWIDHEGIYHFPDWVRVYRAYDHGFHPDPAICLWFAVYGRRILCFKEQVWFRKLAKVIAKDITDDSRGMPVVTTFCDPSIDIETGADVLTIRQKFEDAGVPMDPSLNDREVFADAIHTMLEDKIDESTPRLQFYKRGVPYTTKWIGRMKFNEKNPAAMAEHKHDHGPVCVAYFGMSQIPETSEKTTGKLKRWQIPPKHGARSATSRIEARMRARAR